MTLSEVLAELRRREVRLAVDAQGLRVEATAGVLSEALKAELRRRREQLRTIVVRYGQPYGPLGVLLAERTRAEPSAGHTGGSTQCDTADADPQDNESGIRERAPFDPRPDLDATSRDAVWWSVLLALTVEQYGASDPHGVYAALHLARCLGAALVRLPGGTLRIVAGAVAVDEWRTVRETWLRPHRRAVAELLSAVVQASPQGGRWPDGTPMRTEAEGVTGPDGLARTVRVLWPLARTLSPEDSAAVAALPIVYPDPGRPSAPDGRASQPSSIGNARWRAENGSLAAIANRRK